MKSHLPEEREILVIQIQEQLNALRSRQAIARVPINGWQYVETGNHQPPGPAPRNGWKNISLGTHWGEDRADWSAWFRAKTQVPKAFLGKDSFVTLDLSIAREGLIYFNEVPFHGISENHKSFRVTHRNHLRKPLRILVEAYTEAVRYPAPKYYGKFEHAEFTQIDRTIYNFCWDLQVAVDVLKTHDPSSSDFQRLLGVLSDAMTQVQPFPEAREELQKACSKTQRWLKKQLSSYPSTENSGRILVCGHSHIDTAWLWPLQETKRKCGRTFSSVLQLMETNPEFTFAQGQPQLYQYTKEHFPKVFEGIKRRVKEGRWDPAGPAWVEMDSNLSGGEAIIRQFLYGNRFLEKEFGLRNNVCWLPDAFGYTWSLPQILKGCEVDVFVTTKIDWSMITRFPYTTFEWEGIDGTRILAMMPPLNYNGNLIPKDCKQQWDQIRQKDQLDEMLFSFGWGDGGGGPTQEMIENGKRLKDIAGIPKVRYGTITGYYQDLLESIRRDHLPVWNGELYLELHRACQITQARTKRFNRKLEHLLRETEFVSTLSHIQGAAYPRDELETIWRDVMTNQFHDILPGSSVESLYKETDTIYEKALTMTQSLQGKSFRNYAKNIDTRGKGGPLLLFNSLGWDRSDPVSIPLAECPIESGQHVINSSGNRLVHQVSIDTEGASCLYIEPSGVPSVGHDVCRIVPKPADSPGPPQFDVTTKKMENSFFRLELDSRGNLSRILDKRNGREVLEKGSKGNVLQMFHDHPHMHDAWDYDFNVDQNRWDWDQVESIEVTESGPVRGSIEIVRKTDHSTLRQRIVLYSSCPRIDFETEVDWWEKHKLLKVAFPVAIRSPKATYEIQFGTIERATHDNTPFDRARFEVPHHRWMDLSEGDYGVSVANDCKYGSDIQGNTMRLSLLRGPVHPDPHADEGKHSFVYSLIPHSGDWRQGNVVQLSAELNMPMKVVPVTRHAGELSPRHSWLSTDARNVLIETLKREEDGQRIVIRVYESEGSRGVCTLKSSIPIKRAWNSNLVERDEEPIRVRQGNIRMEFMPYSIRTLMVEI